MEMKFHRGSECSLRRSDLKLYQLNLMAYLNAHGYVWESAEHALHTMWTCSSLDGHMQDPNSRILLHRAANVDVWLGFPEQEARDYPPGMRGRFLRRNSIGCDHSIRVMVLLYLCQCKELTQHSRPRTNHINIRSAYTLLHLFGKREKGRWRSSSETTATFGLSLQTIN